MKKVTNVVLVGLGKHSMKTYWSFFEILQKNMDLSVVALIDLETNMHVVNAFLESAFVQPKQSIFLKDYQSDDSLYVKRLMDSIHKDEHIDKLIIATEPRAHGIYMDWALSRGIDVLVEKPVIGFAKLNSDKDVALKVGKYVSDIADMAESNQLRVSVQAQRRYNKAYAFAHAHVKEFVKKFGVPISFISVHHEDGLWNSTEEFMTEESNPYKYGYGKLLHSGYHFVDLFCWFAQINKHADGESWADAVTVSTEIYRPIDLAQQLKSFQLKERGVMDDANKVPTSLGEIDCYNSIQYKKDGFTVTTGRVDMMQNTVSSREGFDGTYPGKQQVGVRKYEEVCIYAGPLLKVRIYTINEKPDDITEYYFKVEISRNSALIGGKDFEVFDFKREFGTFHDCTRTWTPNQIARLRLCDAFISGREQISTIESHVDTNKMLSLMYQNIVAKQSNGIPYSTALL